MLYMKMDHARDTATWLSIAKVIEDLDDYIPCDILCIYLFKLGSASKFGIWTPVDRTRDCGGSF